MRRQLTIGEERWPLASAFVIARGAKTEARVVVVEICEGAARGWGEAVPYGRYGESLESVVNQIESVRASVEAGCDRRALAEILPAGAARNAVDCALWDLEAKMSSTPVWRLARLPRPEAVTTAYTLSLGTAVQMAAAASAQAARPLLKLKIGGGDDLDRVQAVRQAAPNARLILDANEALSFEDFNRLGPDLASLGVVMVEQPMKAGEDEALEGYASPVLLCADESIHTRRELSDCAARYGAVNIKLDKTGGLTEALALKQEALSLGLQIMAGCMVGTSLSMAPALLVAQGAAVVDLDGPLLLARDRRPGLVYEGSKVAPSPPDLWG